MELFIVNVYFYGTLTFGQWDLEQGITLTAAGQRACGSGLRTEERHVKGDSKAACAMTPVISNILPRKDWCEHSSRDHLKTLTLNLGQFRGQNLKKITIPPRCLQVVRSVSYFGFIDLH